MKTNMIFAITGVILIAVLSSGVTAYFLNDNKNAKIVSIKPFTITHKTPYQVCYTKRYTKYHQPADSDRIIGGLAGGATGGVIGYAISANPIVVGAGAVGGALLGQQVQKHVSKPTASTKRYVNCVIKYKTTTQQNGYIVSYIHKDQLEERVLMYQPSDKYMSLAILKNAPTPDQASKQLIKNDDNDDEGSE